MHGKTIESRQNAILLSAAILRMAIGWHFLYGGLWKVFDPDWSAATYLSNASGPFSSFFQNLAANPQLLSTIDFLNQWGLAAIGLSLILGLLSRWASVAGMFLLALYYLSNPPFIGNESAEVYQGQYLIINANLIELVALWVLYYIQDSKVFGLDYFLKPR